MSGAVTSLRAEVYGPLRNLRFDAYENGVVVTSYELPEDYSPFDADPSISRIVYRRNGGELQVLSGLTRIDAPLEAATTYDYEFFGADFDENILTAPAAASVTTLPGGGLTTSRISLTEDGLERTLSSTSPAVSGDGRYVVYTALERLVPNSNTFRDQIYRYDRQTGTTLLISRSGDGAFADGGCSSPSISDDGRFTCFVSAARNLSVTDTDSGLDVFLYDAETGTVSLVSAATTGVGSANSGVVQSVISADGTTVGFVSAATNLHPEATEVRRRAYLYNTLSTELTLVPLPDYAPLSYTKPGEVQEVVLSGDGAKAFFRVSYPQTNGLYGNLQVIWLYDLSGGGPGVISPITRNPGAPSSPQALEVSPPGISRDGRFIAFFARKPLTPSGFILSETSDYAVSIQYNPFNSAGFVLDLQSNELEVFTLSPTGLSASASSSVDPPAVSDDGQTIAFTNSRFSSGYPLVVFNPSPSQSIFVRDRSLGRTFLVNRSTEGDYQEDRTNRESRRPRISADGRQVVYDSLSAILVGGDTNNAADIFLTELDLAPPDLNAPTWPVGSTVEAINLGATLVDLAWSEAEDAEGTIAGYRIFGDGEILANTGPDERMLQVPGLNPETTILFKVEAIDLAGNLSNDGPSLEVTTAALGVGDASLSAPVIDGGRVQLAWDPALGTILGYVVQRRSGTGDWVDLAEVGADVTTFLDSGLPASAAYAYRVLKRPSVGEPEPHTGEVEVTTRPLSIASVVAAPDTVGARGLLAIEGEVVVTMTAETGRNAEVALSYDRWIDRLDPSQGTETVEARLALTETVDPGVYTTSWVLPAGASLLQSVTGFLSDGFGAGISQAAAGFPRSVEAQFAISVDSGEGEFSGVVFSLWSEALRAGCSQAVSGTSSIAKGGLPPGSDYRLRLLQGTRVVQTLTDVTLRSGLVTVVEQSIQPTTAALFSLKDPDGNPRGGFVVNLYTSDTDRLLGFSTVADDGSVDAAPGLVFPPGLALTYRLSREPWDLSAGPHPATIPDAGSRADLALEWSDVRVPPARITGRVTYPDGSPAKIKIVGGGALPGLENVIVVTSGDDGSYELDPVYGRTFVNIGGFGPHRKRWFAKEEVDVSSGGTTVLDLILEERAEYTVRIDELELVYASGRIERINPANLPVRHSIDFQLIEDGELFSSAAKVSSRESFLGLTIDARSGDAFTLRVNPEGIGFRRMQIPLVLGEETEITIPSIRLEMQDSAYATARLLDPDGQPLGSQQRWRLGYSTSVPSVSGLGQEWIGVTIEGYGPELELPLPEGERGYSFAAFPFENWRSFRKVFLIQPGRNDLGDLQFVAGEGLIAPRNVEYSLYDRGVMPGQLVSGSIGIRNPLRTTLDDWRLELDLPQGISLVETGALADGKPVEVLETAAGVGLRLPQLASGQGLRIRFLLQVASDFEGDRFFLPTRLTYSLEGEEISETLGIPIVNLIRGPSLSGPEVVTSRTIELNGTSSFGTLRIFDGQEMIGQTSTTRYGFWSMKVELGERPIPYWHTLTAVLTDWADGTELRSESIEVLHNPLEPKPVHVRFRQPTDEARDLEQVLLAGRFPDVGEWKEFEVPESGPALFWQRMLAGFPFDFEVQFEQPGLVSDVSFEVDGPAGGIGDAVHGGDGVFRARIPSVRNAVWRAGPISTEYETASGLLPRWINDLVFEGPLELVEPIVPTDDARPQVQGNGVTDLSYRQEYSIREDEVVGEWGLTLQSDQTLDIGPTTSLTFPGGSIDYPSESAVAYESSVNWTFSGNRFSATIVTHIPLERVISQDNQAPRWPEETVLTATEASATGLTLGWTAATDEFWVERYRVYQGETLIGETEGDVRTLPVTGLEAGTTYEFRVEAFDVAGHPSIGNPTLSVEFDGASTQTRRLPPAALVAFENPSNGMSLSVSTAAAGGGYVRVGHTVFGDLLGPAGDLIGSLKGFSDSFDKVDRWKQMLDTADSCGANLADKEFLEDRIKTAEEALVVQNLVGTTLSMASLGFATTGVGAPLSAALALTSLATNIVLEDVAQHEDEATEEAFKFVMEGSEECEDPEDDEEKRRREKAERRSTRRTMARPVWKIDPSGYVYEVTEDSRLEGVTAILLEGESENGPWVVSAAEEFGEINPQVTPVNGVYAWDVPAGWWQVMYQKEGYETAFSDVLPVPPPHFDVNIPLKSLAPPEVSGVTSLNNGAALRIDFAGYIRATMASPDTIRLRDEEGNLLPGQAYAPAEELVDNPHTESPARDIARRLLFVPDKRLSIGATYRLEVDGVMESYGEIPLVETVVIEVTIRDERTGTWFGSFDPGGGLWSMQIGADGGATLSGYDPATGRHFDVEGSVDDEGNLSIDLGTLAAGAQLTATLVDGTLAGSVSILGYTAEGSLSPDGLADETGVLVYRGAIIGSTGTTLTAILGPDGTLLATLKGELGSAAVLGSINDAFLFSGFLPDGSELDLDLSDPSGTMSGVLALDDSTWSVLGAVEGSSKARLVNVSGRGPVAAGSGNLIAGFVIRGSAENPMLVRAVGPGLETFGLTGVLQRPRIRLLDQTQPAGSGLVAENTDWLQAGNRNELRAVFGGLGAFFLEDGKTDATVFVPVSPGPYTALVQGVDGDAGITLVEAYDADLGVFGTTSEGVANLSLRGNVGSGSGVMIAGFVIEGNAPRRILLRGVGPGLSTLGVSGFLEDPEITLFQGADPVAGNQSWGSALPNEGLADLFPVVGAFALESGSADAALVLWLAPGPYTVRLRNEVAGQGTGLIEIYDLP